MGVDATADDGCRNLKYVHIFREKKCAQGYSKSLRMGISTLKTYFNFKECCVVVITEISKLGVPDRFPRYVYF